MHKGFGSGGAVLAGRRRCFHRRRRRRGHEDPHPRSESGEPKYDKKTMAAFEGTTAAKVLSVRLDGVAYHAPPKEPKTPEAADYLAKFLAAHAAACRAGPFAWLKIDTNLAKEATDSAFRREVEASGLQVSASVPTTSKRRSRLHGQCYDDNKCHKTVVAARQVRRDGRLFDIAADGARPRRRRAPRDITPRNVARGPRARRGGVRAAGVDFDPLATLRL